MFKSKTYIIFIVAIVAIAGYFYYINEQKTDWQESFFNSQKKPFDTYILFQLLPDLFKKDEFEGVNTSLSKFINEHQNDSNINVIQVSGSLYFDDDEVDSLYKFIAKGNRVFLSAHSFDYSLLDSLGIQCYPFSSFYFQENDTLNNGKPRETAEIQLSYTDKNYQLINGKRFNSSYFYSYNYSEKSWDILGNKKYRNIEDQNEYNNFVSFEIGKGIIYLHSVPFYFTNYAMVKNDASTYAADVFSVLPQQKTYWIEDQYGNFAVNQSEVRFVLSNDALRWAWYLFLFGGLFLAIFALKRRQNYIAIITPLKNSSLEFIETVGRLYFQKKNNADLAHKKGVFFLEKFRSQYGIQLDLKSPESNTIIIAKTGAEEKKTALLLKFLILSKKRASFDDQKLFEFHQIITYFYQKMNE